MLNGDAHHSLEVEQAFASDPLPYVFKERSGGRIPHGHSCSLVSARLTGGRGCAVAPKTTSGNEGRAYALAGVARGPPVLGGAAKFAHAVKSFISVAGLFGQPVDFMGKRDFLGKAHAMSFAC